MDKVIYIDEEFRDIIYLDDVDNNNTEVKVGKYVLESLGTLQITHSAKFVPNKTKSKK